MTDLNEYKGYAPEAFDDQELPSGHLERFEAKLDSVPGMGKKSKDWTLFKRIRLAAGMTAVAAAAIAAVIFINRPDGQREWFADVSDDPVAVYLTYSEKVSEMYRDIFKKDINGNWETTIGCIAEEAVPMIDQLPDELDNATKVAIMKEYYGRLLDGLDKINKIKEL